MHLAKSSPAHYGIPPYVSLHSLLVNRKILILHYKDRTAGMVLAFELQFFYYYNAGFIFSRLFCSCSCFCFCFFLVIYYLVGAYEGLGRAFYITIYQIQLFFLLNRSYSKLLFWIAPFKFFLFFYFYQCQLLHTISSAICGQ
ncbi:Uncharacterised protein [Streptococcus pneumoniae]|nr:Uncharacterised protein [Streptococcus pneumoniae]